MVAGGQSRGEVAFVKLLLATSVLAGTTFLSGCASQGRGVVLDPVGPPAFAAPGVGSDGILVVYSAYEQGAEFNGPCYRRQFTDYKILSADGKLLRPVHNDSGTLVEAPKRVQLPVGTYQIIARVNSYRRVTVPVVIRADLVTTVHLEGSPGWPNGRKLAQSNPVRLPDGEIAGWRASPSSSPKP
jgi:hypothetical protein